MIPKIDTTDTVSNSENGGGAEQPLCEPIRISSGASRVLSAMLTHTPGSFQIPIGAYTVGSYVYPMYSYSDGIPSTIFPPLGSMGVKKEKKEESEKAKRMFKFE